MAERASQGHLRPEARAAAGEPRLLPRPEQPAALDLGRHHQRLLPHRPQQAAPRPKSAPFPHCSLNVPPVPSQVSPLPTLFFERAARPKSAPSLLLLPMHREGCPVLSCPLMLAQCTPCPGHIVPRMHPRPKAAPFLLQH